MTIRERRRRDGLHQIRRVDGVMPPGERYLVMCVAFFVVSALFVSGIAPVLLPLGIVSACTIAESLLLLDAWLQLRRPAAEIHEISSAYALRSRR